MKRKTETVELVSGDDAVVAKYVALCITTGELGAPEYEVLACYMDRFLINDAPATDADAAAFIRRMDDAGIAELLRVQLLQR